MINSQIPVVFLFQCLHAVSGVYKHAPRLQQSILQQLIVYMVRNFCLLGLSYTHILLCSFRSWYQVSVLVRSRCQCLTQGLLLLVRVRKHPSRLQYCILRSIWPRVAFDECCFAELLLLGICRLSRINSSCNCFCRWLCTGRNLKLILLISLGGSRCSRW